VEVRDGARTVPLSHGRQRLLLAVRLLHANEVLSIDRLIDALWGEAPPPTAAHSLHKLVFGLHKAHGDGELVSRGTGRRAAVGSSPASLAASLLNLQRAVGNAAVAGPLQRQPAGTLAPPGTPSSPARAPEATPHKDRSAAPDTEGMAAS